jgi:hypothetical protein
VACHDDLREEAKAKSLEAFFPSHPLWLDFSLLLAPNFSPPASYLVHLLSNKINPSPA